MSTNKPDRRVQRTRRNLQAALLALVAERGYEAVTVQDIAERADVGRATFYLHYTDKEQLMLDCVDQVLEELTDHFAVQSTDDFLDAGRVLGQRAFEHAQANRTVYQALLGRQVGAQLVTRMQDRVAQIIMEQLRAVVGPRLGQELYAPLAHHTAGALLALLSWWLSNDLPHTPAFMAELHQRLVGPGMLALFMESAQQQGRPGA